MAACHGTAALQVKHGSRVSGFQRFRFQRLGLILVRIDHVASGHGDTERAQGVQDSRAAMSNQSAFKKHEEFEIVGEQQIRQDRFEPAEWTCRVVLGGHDFAVSNYSSFGLAVLGAPVDELEAADVPFYLRDVEVARLRLLRVRVERLGVE